MDRFELTLCVADTVIRFESPFEIEATDEFKPFLSNSSEPKYVAEIKKTDKLSEPLEKPVLEENCYRVYRKGKNYIRSFFNAPSDYSPYALAQYDYPNGKILIEYIDKGENILKELSNCFFILGLEAVMMRENRFCIHSALVKTEFGGLLFSGRSGIGKSTQADLWQKYENSRLINGDRPIISKEADSFRGFGSPYAGSSKCYRNEYTDISAVIMLAQDKNLSADRLSLKESFRKIYELLTVNSWNPEFTISAFDFAVNFAKQVPVYSFRCTPDFEAVEFLKETLRRDLK